MLELRHLQVLGAIAREGSLAGAARALHYSQPTVTHHLATMEAHFDARLVDRTPRGARLTEVGELLLPHAEAVLRRVQLAEREARALVRHGALALHIGTFPTAGALLLPPAVKALRSNGVQVSMVEGELPTLLTGLRYRELHVALVYSQPGDRLDLEDEFVLHPLLEDPLLAVLPADHPAARLESVPLTALREEGWIIGTTESDPVERLLSWACGQAGFEPAQVLRTDDYGVMQGFVAAGVGVALIPRLALGNPAAGVAVRRIQGPPLVRQIGLAALRSTAARSVAELLAALQAQARCLVAAWAAQPGFGAPGPEAAPGAASTRPRRATG